VFDEDDDKEETGTTGAYWYRCIPTMRDEWFEGLMSAHATVLDEHQELADMLGRI